MRGRARFGLVSRRLGRRYVDLFAEAGANVRRAAEQLHTLMESWPDEQELRREILLAEQEGDRITHDIIRELDTSGATPVAREDLFALATVLDDVVDYTEEAADFLGLYKIEAPMEQAQALTAVLRDAARQLEEALGRLERRDELAPYLVEIKRLENEGDRLTREALASLFAGGIDPIAIIRWKDIFERIEQAIDACDSTAHILESITVKYG